MANTTFNGPVRSENGFETINKNSSTGAVTIQAELNSITGGNSVVADAACNAILNGDDLAFVYRPAVIDYVSEFKRTGRPSLAPYTPETVRQSQQLEFWSPQSHFLCNSARKDWVKFVVLILTRRLHLPHVVAVIILRSMRRSDLGAI